MRVLDLFSGIGGFSLGLERAGMQTVAFCEINPYARAVLAKHWPGVPCYEDVRALNSERLSADGISVDVVCGGFPCQDISFAGAGAGLDGARSGLWREMHRIISETRPCVAIIENTSSLRSRGLDVVLGALNSIGYDAEWHCIPAAAVGAPHRRDRVWIVAYPRREQHEGGSIALRWPTSEIISAPDANGESEHDDSFYAEVGSASESLADADRISRNERRSSDAEQGTGGWNADRGIVGQNDLGRARSESGARQWLSEPDVGRVADGVPSRVDRLACLGNAVVPQIPEMIGRAIMVHATAPAHVPAAGEAV